MFAISRIAAPVNDAERVVSNHVEKQNVTLLVLAHVGDPSLHASRYMRNCVYASALHPSVTHAQVSYYGSMYRGAVAPAIVVSLVLTKCRPE